MNDFLDFKQTCSSFAFAEVNDIKINVSFLIKNDSIARNLSTSFQDQLKVNSTFLNSTDMMKLMYYCKNLSPNNQMKHNLIKYFYPLLSIFGIFSNLISLHIILEKIKSKSKFNRNFSFILANMCLACLLIILLGCLREYIDEMLDVSINSISILSCRLFYFFCYFLSAFSSHLYTYIAYSHWQNVKNLNRKDPQKILPERWNRIFILMIFAYCVMVSLPFLYFPLMSEKIKHDLNDPLNIRIYEKCEISKNGDILLTAIDSIIFHFIPFFLSIVFSLLAIINLLRRKELIDINLNYNKNDSQSTKKTNLDSFKNNETQEMVEIKKGKFCRNFPEDNFKIDSVTDTNMEKNIFNDMYSFETSNPKTSSYCKLAILVFLFPIAYLVMNCPIFLIILFRLVDYYFNLEKNIDYEISFVISKIFMYLLVSMNVFVFVLIDNFHRKKLIGLFIKIRKTKDNRKNSI